MYERVTVKGRKPGFPLTPPPPLPAPLGTCMTVKGRKPGFVQLAITQMTSALWHGLYPGT